MLKLSPLQRERLKYAPRLPDILKNIADVGIQETNSTCAALHPDIPALFPFTSKLKAIKLASGPSENVKTQSKPIRVGVVLSGGQASGGHNVIIGLFDSLKKLNALNVVLGFLDGPGGIVKGNYIELTEELLADYRNQGGFDLIGSGRTKIETAEQQEATDHVISLLDLDGLVVIGGDDSNTNAALLAERFVSKGMKTSVVGVPKTIDGDLRGPGIEISFGFDTACKVYAELIGNLTRDALSAKKYYFFVKLMGRSASHIALECAHQTHPNLTLIGEEIAREQMTLSQIVDIIAELVVRRADRGKNYGVILIPEGLIEFIPEINALIKELNTLLANVEGQISTEEIGKQLSKEAAETFYEIPSEIRVQLILTRDPHGNVQVSKIETERLLLILVEQKLLMLASKGKYRGAFSPQPLFLGYEGRSALPSNFDAQYSYALGATAAILIDNNANGYICSVQQLTKPASEWECGAVPLTSLLTIEKRKGEDKPVIKKTLVDLHSSLFKSFEKHRGFWAMEDDYIMPGPIQFFGPPAVTDSVALTLH